MRYVRDLSTVLCLILFSPAWAFDTPSIIDQGLLIFTECNNYLGDTCTQIPAPIKRALEACEINSKAHECDKIAHANPELQNLILSCSPKDFCQQQTAPPEELALKCWKGLHEGVTDPFTSLAEAIKGAWQKSQAESVELLTRAAQTNFSTYLPPSLRRTSANPAEKNKNIAELWAAAELAVKDKYHQYACYRPEAQQELACYVFASVLDPTIVLGKGLRLAKAAKLIKALEREKVGILTKALSREEFTKAYLYYSPTSKEQNLAWMSLAEKSSSSKNIKFFDVENSVMKDLNDTVKNKNLVTSLTNYHKALLEDKTTALFTALKKDYPDLELVSYSDFKSSRFAFKGRGPPDLEKRLDQVLQETNRDFTNYVHANNIIKKTDTPENWFRAGYGETADQATLASRFSRQSTENNLVSFNSSEMQGTLTAKLQQTESLRASLQSELGKTSMLEGGTKKTLSADALDIIRKNNGDLSKTQSDLKSRFGLSDLSTSTVEKMQSYARSVDEFSPGIHVAERSVANLDEAVFGGLSADMSGMGAKNLNATALALSESQDLNTVLVQTRKAEKLVTTEFQQQKKAFQTAMTDALGESRVRTLCSGDDCIAIPKQAISQIEKQKILQNLSDAGYSSKFRLSFIPENVTEVTARNQLSVHGESIEKILRKNLADKMEPQKLKGLIFGVDMKTTKLNQGDVNLLTANHPDVKLTSQEQKMIRENFKKALQQFNTEHLSDGIGTQYRAWQP
jgi:hypothetical protein